MLIELLLEVQSFHLELSNQVLLVLELLQVFLPLAELFELLLVDRLSYLTVPTALLLHPIRV